MGEVDLRVVEVPVPDRSYDVLVGRGARRGLDRMLGDVLPDVGRVAIVTQAGIGFDVADCLPDGVAHEVFTVDDGEAAKTLSTVEGLCRAWARWGLTRGDAVLAVGGGLVTDVAGFAAASYHRGIPVVHVATSLLGMVDAAIGGKTGVNLPEGKNLVGAFWQPHGVICDLDALDTLPPRELRCGLGELAKYRFLPGGEGLEDLDLVDQVAQCVRIKADVVAADEREGGLRAILNYGHTLGHAIEIAGGHDLRHGEAVSIGLVYAASLARRLGRIDDERVAVHRRVVGSYDLPTTLPSHLGDDDLVELMARDKKALRGFTFVLDGPVGVEVVPDVDAAVVRDAIADVRDRAVAR